MKSELIPHTREWFLSLKKHNPVQAQHTRRVLELAGNHECCSVCGDVPVGDYIIGREPVWSMRLCDTCRHLHLICGLKLHDVAEDLGDTRKAANG